MHIGTPLDQTDAVSKQVQSTLSSTKPLIADFAWSVAISMPVSASSDSSYTSNEQRNLMLVFF